MPVIDRATVPPRAPTTPSGVDSLGAPPGGGPRKPLLPGLFRVIPMGPDAVQVRSSGRVVRLTGRGVGEAAPALLAALDGEGTVEEVAARVSVDVGMATRLVRSLFDDGIVLDCDDRAIAVPATAHQVLAGLGGQPASRAGALRASRVAFVGLGPVARLAAEHVATSGVGRLDLVDDGEVTPADQLALVRPATDSGRPRPDVCGEECVGAASLGPVTGLEVTTGLALTDVLSAADLVVVEVDEAGRRAEAVNASGLAKGARLLFHASTAVEGVLGPAVLGPGRACYHCLVERRLSHLRHYDEYVAFQAALDEGRVPTMGAALSPGAAALLGGLLSLEMLRLLVEEHDEGLLVADLRTLAVKREELLAVPGCPLCGRDSQEIAVGSGPEG